MTHCEDSMNEMSLSIHLQPNTGWDYQVKNFVFFKVQV